MNNIEANEVLINYGYTPMEEFVLPSKKIRCKTSDGYIVYPKPTELVRRGSLPVVFSKYNPDTIYNISVWLKNNGISTTIESTEFLSKEPMQWKCGKCGKKFYTLWDTIHNGKTMCNYCAKSSRYDNNSWFIKVKEECEKYGYTLLSSEEEIVRSNSKFKYLCKKHIDNGEQYSTPDDMLNGHKHCRYCGIESRGKKRRLSEDLIKSLVEEKGFVFHGVNYNNANNKSKKVNVEIICPAHENKGIQIVKFDNLKNNKCGCKLCIGRDRTKEDLQSELTKMGKELFVIEYSSFQDPVVVKCKLCNAIFTSTVSSLLSGVDCKCHSSSLFEETVRRFLDKNNIKYERQYKFIDCIDIKPLPFDFYLPELNIVIEVDGEGHLIPIPRGSMSASEAQQDLELIQRHDRMKTELCEKHHIRLIRIPYWERDSFTQHLLHTIQNNN